MAVDHQDTQLRTFHPRWPVRSAIDPERVRFSYWQEVDTLMVDFTGRNSPAISVPLDLDREHDYLYLRLDPVTEEVVGLQIEDFLNFTIHRHSDFLDMLDLATLHGITPAEIAEFRRNLAPSARKRAAVDTVFDQFAPIST